MARSKSRRGTNRPGSRDRVVLSATCTTGPHHSNAIELTARHTVTVRIGSSIVAQDRGIDLYSHPEQLIDFRDEFDNLVLLVLAWLSSRVKSLGQSLNFAAPFRAVTARAILGRAITRNALPYHTPPPQAQARFSCICTS